jgi:hypothetical protein
MVGGENRHNDARPAIAGKNEILIYYTNIIPPYPTHLPAFSDGFLAQIFAQEAFALLLEQVLSSLMMGKSKIGG